MAYYRTCPHCGANLDPGEHCDCRPALEDEARRLLSQLTDSEIAEIMEEVKAASNCGANCHALGNLQQKAPASVSSTGRDGVEQIETPVSTSNDNTDRRK